MESKSTSEEVDIQKYWLVLKRRWVPAVGVFGTVVAVALFSLLQQKPVYDAEGKLLIKSNSTSSLTGVGEGIGELKGLNLLTAKPLDTQAEIVRSLPIMQETVKALDLKNAEGQPLAPDDLAEGLSVKGIPNTDILSIFYQAEEPKFAAEVVNKVIEIYISNNLQANRAEAVSAREFIVEQLPKTEAAVKAADLALRRFKEENKVVVLAEEASAVVQVISGRDSQITEAQADLSETTAQLKELQSRVGLSARDAVPLVALSQVPSVQEVLQQLHTVQEQLAVERTRYRAGYPTIENLENKAAALNDLLEQRVQQVIGNSQQVSVGNLQIGELQQGIVKDLIQLEAQRSGLVSRISTLSNTQSAYLRRANALPRLEQIQKELERRLNAAQVTYETLLQKLQEVRIAENQNIGNIRIVAPAIEPAYPTSSKKVPILGGAIIAGFLLGIATAFSLDLVDRSVKTVKEARELFGFTLLGVIPALSRGGKKHSKSKELERLIPRVFSRDEPYSPVNESYQMLQTNLKFLSSDKKLKTIVVTSSVTQEGKSEVSANLAAAMAQVGYRVILIDADMRHPTQHHIWRLTNSAGLSNVMVNQIGLDSVVQEVTTNLYILPSGLIPPNPIALLDSERMASLVASLSENYDYVVFDTPPLAGTSDAAVLGKMVDGILLVVRPGRVDSTSANAAKEFLEQSGQNTLGIVINGIDVKNEPDSYFYYTREQSGHPLIAQASNFTGQLLPESARDRSQLN